MILLLASAKKLDAAKPLPTTDASHPAHLKPAAQLVSLLKRRSLAELAQLMGISDDLAALTAGRMNAWKPPFTVANARPAALAYHGEAFAALDAWSLSADDLAFGQQHLRIVSGLYGLLRPLDLIQPYRLEMGTRLGNPKGPDLYAFWRDALTRALAADLRADRGPLVNLASSESFKALDPDRLPGGLITPVFEDLQRGAYRIVAIHAKRARGRMVRFALQNRLTRPEDLQAFGEDGYGFERTASTADRWVFRR